MVVYIYFEFHKISLTILKLQNRHDFHTKTFKGHNSTKNVGGVIVLILCTSSDSGLYLYQVS